MKKEHRGILCSVFASIGFGCGATLIKLIYRVFDELPFQDLSFMRSAVCLIAFFLIALKKGQLKVTWKQLLFYAFTGIFGLFAVQYFLFLALQMVPVGVSSFVQSSSTLMVCVYSFVVLRESPTKEKIAGIIVGLLGLTLVVWKKGMFTVSAMFGLGIAAAVLSGVGKTVYLLCGKYAGKQNRRPSLMAYGMLFCTITGLPFASKPTVFLEYFSDIRLVLVLLVYFLVFSVVPYLLTFHAVELIPASSAGTLNVIEPLAAALSAFLVLGEPITWNQLVGGLLIVSCILLIQRDTKHHTDRANNGGNNG